jgi:hypothetical protein
LAKLVPARYDKPEETTGIVSSLDTYMYEINRPVLAVPPESKLPTSAQVEHPASVTKVESAPPAQIEKPVQDEAAAQTDYQSGAGKETKR